MAFWLKLGYHTAATRDPHYWERDVQWVGDGPGVNSPYWRNRPRPEIGDTYPPHGPRYEIGDRLVMYLTGPKKCPAILEVTGEPRWDPDRQANEGLRSDADRWAVLTDVRHVASVPIEDAPPLELLGVPASSVGRKGHLSLEPWQYAEAERLMGGIDPPTSDDDGSTDGLVPLEGGHVEGYEVTTSAEKRTAERREWRLVRDYADTLEAQGDEVFRNRLRVETGTTILSDLFNRTRGQLIEAKAGTSRGDIRMAIGQLADYSRHVDPGVQRAVLLEAKPNPDLMDLLATQGIKVIWREGAAFADNASGEFT